MDAFLNQIQPYLDQVQVAAIGLFEAARADPTTTAAFAAVFLLLVFLRRRRRRQAQIAEPAAARRADSAKAPPTPTADATPAAPASTTQAVVSEPNPSPETKTPPGPKPHRQAASERPAGPQAADASAARPAPLVLTTQEPPRDASSATSDAKTESTDEAQTAQAPKRAATGPEVIQALRTIVRASETDHVVKQDVPLGDILTATHDVSDTDLAKTINFGIFSPEGTLVAVVEDYTDTPKGAKPNRDPVKRALLRKAGIPVTELLAGYTQNQLAAHLNKLMRRT